jgi:hypothetical protein
MSGADFSVTGADQLDALSRSLKAAGNKELPKAMRKRLTAATKPIVQEIRAAALEIPSEGRHSSAHDSRSAMSKRGNSGSLRAALARGVQSKVTTSGRDTSVGIKLNASKLPADQRELPKLVEGLKPWRHPLYGDKEHWYPQAAHPFFFRTVRARETAVQREVAQVLTDITNAITP